jgi:radical SAM superfamily enzyme YgiQ (UPF0313 family)
MKICLTSALTISDFVEPQLTLSAASTYTGPQLGVLSLAAALFDKGRDPHLVDVDQLFLEYLRGLEGQSSFDGFFTHVVRHLENLSFDIFGFSSICSSYPLTLRLAREVKRFHPQAQIIVGGPQATVVDVATLEAFSWVDFVVRGEAEVTLPLVLDSLSGAYGAPALERIQGITYRHGNEVKRNPNAPVIPDLDLIPLPAYHLDPHIYERPTIHLEVGRGCPYTCTFCSTNDFFRRNFRLRSTQKMLEHMTYIKDKYGIGSFSLVHDMYTVDRKKVVEFCEALINLQQGFYWTCSARTDRVDDELLALMAEAGCRGIFFGIETGSERLQRTINKNLNLEEAWKRIRCADSQGMKTAVALISAFPDEKREDLRDTIHYYVNSTRYDNAEPQLSLLAPLAETPIHSQYRDRLVFDHIFSDMSHQSWQQDQTDLELIKAHPAIFPNFYALPTTWICRDYFSNVRSFVMGVTTWFRWLPIALLQDSGDFLQVLDRWMQWRDQHVSDEVGTNGSASPYYNRRQFALDFLEFVRTCYLCEMAKVPHVIAALTASEGMFESCDGPTHPKAPENLKTLGLGSFPYQPVGLQVMQLEVDYRDLIYCLRHMGDLHRVPARKVTVAFRLTDQKEIEVRQLTPLSTELFRLCDGTRSVQDIIHHFALLRPQINRIPGEKVCLFGLRRLFEQDLIAFSSGPLRKMAEGVGELS